MPAIYNMTRQAYSATVELAFDYNNQRVNIEPENIVYVMIESDYENQVLPIIYVVMAVDSDMYTNIIRYKETAKFYLNINKQNKNTVASISKNCISGSFSYIPSAQNPNYTEQLNKDSGFVDTSYRRIMVGLVSIELTNKLRNSFNGVYQGIDQATLIGMALEGTDCIIEELTYNDYFDSIMIPPIASRYKLLQYIFDKGAFYDTNFRYFMDFEKSYLLSKKGDAIDAGDGELSSVIVDIRSVTEDEAYYNGIEIKNGAYYLYINPSNSTVTLNQGTEKVANQLVVVDEEKTSMMDISINKTEGSDIKQSFIRSDTRNQTNAAIYKNELETNSIITEILKQHIDGSPFVPNRSILVNNYGEYSKYNGKYLLAYKKEFFKCVAGEFILSCVVGLKKIGNIEPLNRTVTSRAISTASTQSAIKISSANKKNTTRKAIR